VTVAAVNLNAVARATGEQTNKQLH